MTTDGDVQDQSDVIVSGRLVPVGRDGNIVYARSLR